MKKRLLLGILSAAMALSLVGCGATDKKDAFKDGTYEVESKNADDHGYISNLTVEIKDGKISNASYHESKDGQNKRDDAKYNETMEKNSKAETKTNPSKYEPALEKALLEKQSAEIDTVSGATKSSENFKKLATKALENAKLGTTDKTLVE